MLAYVAHLPHLTKENNPMTHEDKDPTPPHGTPRPKPCAVLGCDWFTADGLYCRQHAQVLADYASVCEFAELWLDDNTDTENTHDRMAKAFFQQALNVLHGLVVSDRLGDGEWHSGAIVNAQRLLGFVACDTCGIAVETEELDVNGMCGDCLNEVEFGGVRCRSCGFTLSPDTLACGCPADDQRSQNPFGSALER